jgi:hypothetical protein
MSKSMGQRLEDLLKRIHNIRPSWERPEAFHEAKSEAIGELKSLIADAQREPNGAPVITKAQQALNDLQARAAVPAPPTPVPPAPEPTPTNAEKTPDVTVKNEDVKALYDLIAGLERQVQELRSNPVSAPEISSPAPIPAPETPITQFTHELLKHADNRRTVAILWAAGLSAAEIAAVFDDASDTGAICVRAAVALFLHEHDPATPWRIDDPDSHEPVQRALRPAVAVPTPKPVIAVPMPAAPKPPPQVGRVAHAPEVIYPRQALSTDAGRAIAAQLWAIDNLPLREVSRRFGAAVGNPKVDAVPAWKAIHQFACQRLRVARIQETGEKRKRLVLGLLHTAPATGATP